MFFHQFIGNIFNADNITIALKTALNIGKSRLNQFVSGITGQTPQQAVKQNCFENTFFNVIQIFGFVSKFNPNFIDLFASTKVTALNKIMPQVIHRQILTSLDFRATLRNKILKFAFSYFTFKEVEHTALI